jgi:LacI family transcriptional regulator
LHKTNRMKFETVTIKDIAKALGISTSTVSRALRGSYEINPETKQMVQEYAEKMNYRPNPVALSLKENRSRAIGVIVPEIANHFFSQAINGIDAMAYNCGYHVVIFQSHESYEREVANTEHLVSRRVDGLLVSLSNETDDVTHFRQLQEKGLPIVFFDRISAAIDTHKVVANNRDGAYQATKHLIEAGCRRIAHLTNASWVSISKERLEGYRAALQESGIPYDENYVRYCHHGGMIQDEIEEAITQLIRLKQRPDALLSASDRLTTGCMSTLKKAGLRIPEDILLVGFTNLNVAELLHPSLTSVRQPAYEIGHAATELLIQLIESKKPVLRFETRTLETELCVRNSSVKVV